MISSIAPAIKAVELVKQQRFNALNSLVTDNADTARVKYPEGFNSCFLSLEDFEDRYSNQEERKKTYTVKLPISKIYYKQGQVRMVRPEYCIENFLLFNNTVDFCESENPVVFYDENADEFHVVKKQHSFKKYTKLLCFFCNLFNFLLLHPSIQVCFLYLMNIH